MKKGGEPPGLSIVGAGAAAKAYLEPEEVERLEQAATNLRNHLLIRLLSCRGCRISEALAFTVEDVNLQQAR